MIKREGSPQVQSHWSFTVFRARRGEKDAWTPSGPPEIWSQILINNYLFPPAVKIIISSRGVRTLVYDEVIQGGIGRYTCRPWEKGFRHPYSTKLCVGGYTLISNPLPFLYTIFHRRGTPFSIFYIKNVTLVFNTYLRTLHLFLNSWMKLIVNGIMGEHKQYAL